MMYDDAEPDLESVFSEIEEPDDSAWHAQALADEYASRMVEAWEAGDTDTFQSYALQLAEVDPAAALAFTNEAEASAKQMYADRYGAELERAKQTAAQEHVEEVRQWFEGHPEAGRNLEATTWGIETVSALAPDASLQDRLNEGLALGREAERASQLAAREAVIRQAFRQPTFRNGSVRTPMADAPQVTEAELIEGMRPTPEARQMAREQEVENFRAAFKAEAAPRFGRGSRPANEGEEVNG